MIKLTPNQWSEITHIDILDADGWDRNGDFEKDWNKKLSFEQFLEKAQNSTTQWPSQERITVIGEIFKFLEDFSKRFNKR